MPFKQFGMKQNKSLILAFLLLILVGSICRVVNFAPQIAMAIFGGAVIKDKKLAFILPLFSMLLSDLLFEVLFSFGLAEYGGFYEGQVSNYFAIGLTTLVGFWIQRMNATRIVLGAIAGTTLYFLVSNFFVWNGTGGLGRPHTFAGLLQCYGDALPFYRAALLQTLVFSGILFGGYFLVQKHYLQPRQLA